MLGRDCYSCDVRGDITVARKILQTYRTSKTEKLLSVIALSVNKELNKSETLSNGISKVTILQNCKLSKLEFATWHLWVW